MTDDPAVLYRALMVSDRLPHLRRLTYRCATPARCLLLDAVETPLGLLLHQRRYKYSEAENEARSSESGRRKNTYDGASHWRERTYYLEQSALAYPDDTPAPHLGITCDHVLDHLLSARSFHDDWGAGHAVVLVRPDRSTYVP